MYFYLWRFFGTGVPGLNREEAHDKRIPIPERSLQKIIAVSELPEMWANPNELIQYGVKDGDLLVCEGGEGGRSGIVRNPHGDCIKDTQKETWDGLVAIHVES